MNRESHQSLPHRKAVLVGRAGLDPRQAIMRAQATVTRANFRRQELGKQTLQLTLQTLFNAISHHAWRHRVGRETVP